MKKALVILLLLCGCATGGGRAGGDGRAPLLLDVDRDNVVIDEALVEKAGSRVVRVRFVPGAVKDADGDGVLHVRASNVTLECEGVLRGAEAGVDPDRFSGTGVRVEDVRNVTVRGLEATGFKVGLRASDSDGFVLDRANFDNLWRMRLKSTAQKEHNDDWLWPHENDRQEWVTNYGAAVCVERSFGIKVLNVRVRNGQNGIILDRVEHGMMYDNDCSFLSGWGIAMWRSSENMISRNALDFCVRGYSHGVYNRGQDSAGLLMFEQCCRNVVVENSMTHSGDGVFVFAGKEALGEKPVEGMDYRRFGCNDNVFSGNDCSFAAAHGLEVTFSFGNQIEENIFEGNAICGVWGGYSQETKLLENQFLGNGTPRTAEGGGVNIEHGYHNQVVRCDFQQNSVPVKLWDDDDGGLLKTPWAKANHKGSRETMIAANFITRAGGVAGWVRRSHDIELRSAELRPLKGQKIEPRDADKESTFVNDSPWAGEPKPRVGATPVGVAHPVGGRDGWWGRAWIVMDEWGPKEPGEGEQAGEKRGTAYVRFPFQRGPNAPKLLFPK